MTMTTPAKEFDHLVTAYLRAVEVELANASAARRAELLTDLRDHIAAERAMLDPETEATIRAILDRLGDPRVVAAEALLDEPPAVHAMGSIGATSELGGLRAATPAGPGTPTGPPYLTPPPYPTSAAESRQARRRFGPLGWVLVAFGVLFSFCVAGAIALFAAGFLLVPTTAAPVEGSGRVPGSVVTGVPGEITPSPAPSSPAPSSPAPSPS